MVGHLIQFAPLSARGDGNCPLCPPLVPPPVLKERLFHGNARFQAGKIVLSTGTQLVNLHLVEITA